MPTLARTVAHFLPRHSGGKIIEPQQSSTHLLYRLPMRTAGVVFAALLSVAMFGDEAHPSPRFRTVYILEMADALDQHIASRLSSAGVLWVVLDPANADTVLTDAIDAAFWTWLQRTYPPV